MTARTIDRRIPGVRELWEVSTGDPAVCVAILDGAVERRHPSLAAADLEILGELEAAAQPSEHGTHIASIVFGDHGSEVQGLVPDCRGLLIPIFRSSPEGGVQPASQHELARALDRAVEHGAHVVNVSGGEISPTGEPEGPLAAALRRCSDHGVLIVAAAGNDGCKCLHVPAADRTVLAVGAVDDAGDHLPFSNWGSTYLENGLVASGQDILGALPGGSTAPRTGTSYASAVVSGVAALLLSVARAYGREVRPSEVRAALLAGATACRPDENNDCQRMLRGRLDVPGALGVLMSQTNDSHEILDSTHQSSGLSAESTNPPVAEAAVALPAEGGTLFPAYPAEPVELEHRSALPSEARQIESREPDAAIGAPLTARLTEGSAVAPALAPAGCSCGGAKGKRAVYALASIGYDFGTWSRYEWYVQQMQHRLDPDTEAPFGNPLNPVQLVRYLDAVRDLDPGALESITWTLELDGTPIYAIQPSGPYAHQTLERVRRFFRDQVLGSWDEERELSLVAERCSMPGVLAGQKTLLNGLTVPVLEVTDRGMYNWSSARLIQVVTEQLPPSEAVRANDMLRQFFAKVYYQLRNLGQSPEERALNYAGTNVYQLVEFIADHRPQDIGRTMIQDIRVVPAPICRPGSDCWEVLITVFNPEKVTEDAKVVTRVTIDVSDTVPVTIGEPLSWPEF